VYLYQSRSFASNVVHDSHSVVAGRRVGRSNHFKEENLDWLEK
jgi:hypothetical protein